jgi:hypothetical protein
MNYEPSEVMAVAAEQAIRDRIGDGTPLVELMRDALRAAFAAAIEAGEAREDSWPDNIFVPALILKGKF